VKITFKTKTEIKIEDGVEQTKTTNSIKVKGAEFTTKLSVTEKFEDGQAKLKVKFSTGAEQDIITQPDEALLLAFEELQATGNFNFELTEITNEGITKAVFKATATDQGKFLGLFNINVNLETLIDTDTGEIIQTERPWWAFLVVGADEATVCHVNDLSSVVTNTVLITEVKDHLAHGDGVGECVAECGDSILVEGVETCEVDDSQACTTVDGYAGTETCNLVCEFDSCSTTESCGDGIVNGLEACDDGVLNGQPNQCDSSCSGITASVCGNGVVEAGEQCDDSNTLDGDGCDSLCQIEIIGNLSII